jgi:hypothetical protein
VRHTAEHVVVATGADPIIPPIPGLRALDGIWTALVAEVAKTATYTHAYAEPTGSSRCSATASA